jgi:hypothetical protein
MAGRVAVAIAGGILVLAVWVSVLRTVFVPRERTSLAAQSVLRLVSTVSLAAARHTRPPVRQRLLDQCTPVAMFLLAGVWFAGLAVGADLLAWGSFGLAFSPHDLGGFFLLRTAGAGLAALAWLSGAFLLAAFVTYLVTVTSAYSRRERFVAQFAAEAEQSRDADVILSDYLRTVSRDRLDSTFAEWASWLADLQTTHLAFPVLCYYRPAGELCWAKAALIALDSAAIVQACAPDWAPPNTFPLLTVGGRCLQRITAQLGIRMPPITASHQGREEWPFADSARMAAKAGLPMERNNSEASAAFQRLRVTYAPYASAIGLHLLYMIE